jgi:hypothetical protein
MQRDRKIEGFHLPAAFPGHGVRCRDSDAVDRNMIRR